MVNLWSESDAKAAVDRYAERWGRDLALRTYSARLLGSQSALVIHGGGNTSVKCAQKNIFGEDREALFVKVSGRDLATILPEEHVAIWVDGLRPLLGLDDLDDERLATEVRRQLLDCGGPLPSIEAPVHAVIPERFVDHTHADAILTLSNQPNGEELVREAVGDDIPIISYVVPGLQLAKTVATVLEQHPEANAMIWMHHGIITWGSTARDSYTRMIDIVSRAEAFIEGRVTHKLDPRFRTSLEVARARLLRVAPLLRGILSGGSDVAGRPRQRAVIVPLITPDVIDFVDSRQGRALAVSCPLTTDHLIWLKPLPLWIDDPDCEDEQRLTDQIHLAVAEYREAYLDYVARHVDELPKGSPPIDPFPRVVILPGLGVLCAGPDQVAAGVTRDLMARTLSAKRRIAKMGSTYEGLGEEHLFHMEYRALQRAKLTSHGAGPLTGNVALISGAAGAIGSGICARLLAEGAHVIATDVREAPLGELVDELASEHPGRVIGALLDVTDPESVAAAFDAATQSFGGVDHVIINAGLAHVASLDEMELERFRSLERVNVEGTLFLLKEALRHFNWQGIGGDIVLVSTKNVFAPGAGFGAYSATKAAAHQLCRIASVEFAKYDVRVNMVAPDAVFSHGQRSSGLWDEVGPQRMQARGLNADELKDYYRDRNLLKVRISADQVASGILFFLTRQTPTTGVTLPIDGGLPDATPR